MPLPCSSPGCALAYGASAATRAIWRNRSSVLGHASGMLTGKPPPRSLTAIGANPYTDQR